MKKILFGLVIVVSILGLTASSLRGATAESSSKNKAIILSLDNMLVLNGAVTGESVGRLIREARLLNRKNKNKPIYLFLNTPGGEVLTGIQLIDALNSLDREVHTVVLFAASMGFQITQGLGTRYITKHGELMSHRASGGFEGSFGGKSPSQLENRYKSVKSILDELDEQTVSRTKGKQTLKSYQDAYADELWLTANQAVDQGYADEAINVQCADDVQGTEKHTVEFLGMLIRYETDKCPINTGIINPTTGIATNHGVKTLEEFTKEGGTFGPDCLSVAVSNPSKVCALDTSLTLDKVNKVKNEFVDQLDYNKSNVIPLGKR